MINRRLVISPLALVCSILFVHSALAAPPEVSKVSPDNGAKDVDPATKQIVITFDQPMSHGGRSIVGGGGNFPKIQAINWRDDRTIVIDVQLEPDHDYALSVNSARFTNFRSAAGEICVPYPISFTTAADNNAPKLTAEQNRQAITELRKFIDNDYSYRDLRKVDWDKVFADASPILEQAPTPVAFARAAGQALAIAQDLHLYLRVGERTFPTATRAVPVNMNIDTLARTVRDWKWDGRIGLGTLEGGFTYILIPTWSLEQKPALERAFAAIGMADAGKGIIIDVRMNAGGDEDLAQQVAGCFVSEPKVYAKHTTRSGGQTSPIRSRVVQPNRARPSYRGPVAVLIGRHCMSSNESFIMMMKAAGATLVGETTFGGSGNPRPHELSNGVTIILPSWIDLRVDGSCLEGEGFAPDVQVIAEANEFEKSDPVLEAGLKALRK